MAVETRIGERADAFEVRRRVFMDEQGYVNEFDGIDDDPRCLHVTLYVDDGLAGCARVFPEPLERELVPDAPQSPACPLDDELPAFRRRGLASALVAASDDAARAAGARVCKLHAQEYVRDLYTKLGYGQISDVDYEDEGQPHLWMAKLL